MALHFSPVATPLRNWEIWHANNSEYAAAEEACELLLMHLMTTQSDMTMPIEESLTYKANASVDAHLGPGLRGVSPIRAEAPDA